MGIEDSHHRFYDGINQVIMRGHIAKVFQFCRETETKLTIGPNLKLITTHHPKYDPTFIENLVVSKDGNRVFMRDHQMKFFEWGIKNRSGVGISATGSGKTMILYCMIRYLQNENPDTKIKIIVPNVTLITQAIDDFTDYSSLDDSWSVEDNCTKMHGNKKPDYSKNILITTWQSLKGHHKAFYEQWNHVFVDEVHGADAPVLKNVILKCTNAYTKIGMTGSLKGSGANVNSISEMELIGLFGGRLETFSTAPQLMDLGILPL
jgi:superfamily II DNA or RNA helicase